MKNRLTINTFTLKSDLLASVIVFLIALPLSIGIAIAVGANPGAGLIAGIVGGIVAGWLGGTPLLVSGPTPSLTVVVAGLITTFGWEKTCAITLMAGGAQILFGISRLSRTVLAIAPTVVHAMLAGIGIIIVLQQIHVLLGGNSHSTPLKNIKELPEQIVNYHSDSIVIGGIVIAIIWLWPKIPLKTKIIPAPLVAITAAIIANQIFPFSNVKTIVVNFEHLNEIFTVPDFGLSSNLSGMLIGVFTVAIIGSVESLLSAVVIDRLKSGPPSNLDRDLVGQGIANMISGAIGGLPIAGVIVRSSANINAGGKTRLATILHGLWLLLFTGLLTKLIDLIPATALAALLIVVGIQLVKLGDLLDAKKSGDLIIYTLTMLGVIFVNLIAGVVLGIVVSLFILLRRISTSHITLTQLNKPETNKLSEWLVNIEGTASFLIAPKLTKILQEIPPGGIVTLCLKVDFLDKAALAIVESWRKDYELKGGIVSIKSFSALDLTKVGDDVPRKTKLTESPTVPTLPWKQLDVSKSNNINLPTNQEDQNFNPIKYGIENYINYDLDAVKPILAKLAHRQEPKAVFLTCGDSRVVPNLITSSGPGDLFTIRNVGNLVPTSKTDKSVEAALQYALFVLEVPTIVVCGHSSCGAMAGLLEGLGHPDKPNPNAIETWLQHAYPTLKAFKAGHPVAKAAKAAGFKENDQLGMVNVAMQLKNLTEHQFIKAKQINISGLFLDLATGNIIEITQTTIKPTKPKKLN